MSSQTSRTSSPHHLLYRLERKDDVMTVLHSARGRWLAVTDNKVFTGLPYCHVYSHVVSWRARATGSCKWPNSPNFPSVVVVVVVVCPGPVESGAWPGLAGLPRLPLSHSLAGKWVMFTTATVQRCTAVCTPHPPVCTMNVSLYATSCFKMKCFS